MTDLHATTLIEEVIKAGTSAGAKKGWEERKHGQFSTPRSHAEYMGLHEKLASANEGFRYSKREKEKEYKNNFKVGKKFNRQSYEFHKANVAKADQERSDLGAKIRNMQSTGQHEHPEWGQFTKVEDPKAHKFGGSVDYTSPSGHKVQLSGFGGWSMQRVAASASVKSEHGRKEWTGDNATTSARNFLHDVYGIGATDEEKNAKVKYKTGK